jgi:fused-like protein
VACPGQGGVTELLAPLLRHGDGEVRARACNVVGNLCRFNTAFLEPILAAGIIPALIDRCRDFHLAARKFACFAIGNAGGYSSLLPAKFQGSLAVAAWGAAAAR